VLSWPFAKTLGALARTALTAVSLYHPAPDRDREVFDTVKTALLASSNQAFFTALRPTEHFIIPSRQGRGELVVGQTLLSQLSRDLLSIGLGVRFRAPGTSMHPTIRHGDLITVEPVAPPKLKRGDIVLYRLQSDFIVHRIVNVEERKSRGFTFILRGDASVACDAPVKPEQVLGKVVCLERDHHLIDPYSLRVRLWSRLYPWLARLKRSVFGRFLPQSVQRQEIRAPGAKILVNSKR
jgi:signal peptidase